MVTDPLFLVDCSVSVVVVLHLEDFEPSPHHLEVIVNVFQFCSCLARIFDCFLVIGGLLFVC